MFLSSDDVVPDIGGEQQLFVLTAAPHIQIHGDKGHLFDRDFHLLHGSDQVVVVGLQTKNRGE